MDNLDINDLNKVDGGKAISKPDKKITKSYCPTCKKETEFKIYAGTVGVCTVCNQRKDL